MSKYHPSVQPSIFCPARLEWSDATHLELRPAGGVWVSNPLTGDRMQLGASLPTLTNSGLSAETLYYVYFQVKTGTLTASTTSSTTTDSVEHQTGAADQMLVGWCRTDDSAEFVFEPARRWVCSCHQPRMVPMKAQGTAEFGLAANGYFLAPSNPMTLSYLRHPGFDVLFNAAMVGRHNDGLRFILGLDVGANASVQGHERGTHQLSGEAQAIAIATDPADGTIAFRQTQILIAGSPGTSIDITSDQGTFHQANWWG
ncbi:Hypothetical protein PBC10988_20400 [Planctomycetales bacterium 10988]|nr:Hypothetical protein PBC10988_20400 [Planctomycetales bacterium 10988]